PTSPAFAQRAQLLRAVESAAGQTIVKELAFAVEKSPPESRSAQQQAAQRQQKPHTGLPYRKGGAVFSRNADAPGFHRQRLAAVTPAIHKVHTQHSEQPQAKHQLQ